jgi:hypothetical protein
MGPTVFEDPETPPPMMTITDVRLDHVAVTSEPLPWNDKASGGIVISTPLDAEKVAREVAEKMAHPVRPVPKPTRKPRARR